MYRLEATLSSAHTFKRCWSGKPGSSILLLQCCCAARKGTVCLAHTCCWSTSSLVCCLWVLLFSDPAAALPPCVMVVSTCVVLLPLRTGPPEHTPCDCSRVMSQRTVLPTLRSLLGTAPLQARPGFCACRSRFPCCNTMGPRGLTCCSWTCLGRMLSPGSMLPVGGSRLPPAPSLHSGR